MISQTELDNLLSHSENDRVEKTVSVTKDDKFGEAICAFSNDLANHRQPGYLLIGVKDDGTLSGLKVIEQNAQTLLAFRTDGRILPPPAISVATFSYPEGDVLVVEVLPSRQPPVRYKSKVWIRAAQRRDVANEAEERRLSEKRSSFARSFDTLPCEGSSLEDLALGLFRSDYLPNAIDRETLEANHRDTSEQLASLKFYDLPADCPTHAGILMFGNNPLGFLAGAYVQYVKFAGTDETFNVEFEKTFDGDLSTQLRVINDFIEGQIVKASQPALGEPYEFNYPGDALKELIFNAIIHRDYQSNAPIRVYEFSDRIEIINPGGLFGDARPENFPNVNDYRNPAIASAAKVLGWVNKFNVGVKRAKAALQKNGNPEPQFIVDQMTTFGVIVFRKA